MLRPALDQVTVQPIFQHGRVLGVDDLTNVCEQHLLENLDLASAAQVKDFALAENNARLLHRARLLLGKPSAEPDSLEAAPNRPA